MRPVTHYEDITFAIVVWNDAKRLRALLEHVRPWFRTLAVNVQESPDDTLAVAESIADIVVPAAHYGFGDATFGPRLLPLIKTKWTFKVDADEWPTSDLLEHLGELTAEADARKLRGVWVPFRSWVEDAEWEEQHHHLRLFHSNLAWMPMLHSRPMIDDTYEAPYSAGWIEHKRSLDEMIQDYLNYYRIGKGNSGWEQHNRTMMRDACKGTAQRLGWAHVRAYPWWPEVREIAFAGKEPQMAEPVYCAGVSCSGTRMLYDMVRALGLEAIHASIPGYRFGEINNPIQHPVWWDQAWMEKRFGAGRWIIIDRDQHYAALSATKRKFVNDQADFTSYAAKGRRVLNAIAKSQTVYRIQYEDVIADPQGEYDKLADWLGVRHQTVGEIYDANEKYGPKPPPVQRKPRKTRAKT
jgi:hypothetical protein